MTEISWPKVAKRLERWSRTRELFRCGQERSVRWIADMITRTGVVLADEVGLGKTRVALLVMLAVLEEEGCVVAVVPPGLLAQWRRELRDLIATLRGASEPLSRDWKPAIVRVYRELFFEVDSGDTYPLCKGAEGRFALISQTFDLHRVKTNAQTWRLELPALVRAHMEDAKGHRRNNRWWQYREARLGASDELVRRQDAAAQFLAGLSYEAQYARIFEMEALRPHADRGNAWARASADAIEMFKGGGEGRKLLGHLVGRLVGAVDLLVMDEAHKSRDDDEEDGQKGGRKRFGHLVEEVLVASPAARRLSMTATPIELHPEQWSGLLRRTGLRATDARWAEIVPAVRDFTQALTSAKRRPDEREAIETLLRTAGVFDRALTGVVTRRRRQNQDEFKRLLPAGLGGAHPHRRMSTIAIDIAGLSDVWRSMVLALEGVGIAAKGSEEHAATVRLTDVRYASGLPVQARDQDGGPPGTRKGRRVRAWERLIDRLSADSAATDGAWLWTHPRVTRTADRIEELCAFTGTTAQEKVLVFGRFTAPMRALRDVLNARQVLRIVDQGAVAAVPRIPADAARRLHHEWRVGRERGVFVGRLATDEVTDQELNSLVEDARARLQQRRTKWRERLEKDSIGWMKEVVGRDHGLLERADLTRRIVDVLSDEVFDRFVVFEGRDDVDRATFVVHAQQVWTEHVDAILGHHQDEDALADPGTHGDDQAGPLRLDAERVEAHFTELAEEESASEQRGNFCRMLDGTVTLDARRVLQARFNRADVGPFVVIAQSVVGREGLNLHRACQRVVLFHPEWNPAVIEQQIGRVDRIESRWSQRAAQWMSAHGGAGPVDTFPRIEVESVVFRGTYDEYNANVLAERRASLNAQLFGALLDEETLARVPAEMHADLATAAPDWEPGSAR